MDNLRFDPGSFLGGHVHRNAMQQRRAGREEERKRGREEERQRERERERERQRVRVCAGISSPTTRRIRTDVQWAGKTGRVRAAESRAYCSQKMSTMSCSTHCLPSAACSESSADRSSTPAPSSSSPASATSPSPAKVFRSPASAFSASSGGAEFGKVRGAVPGRSPEKSGPRLEAAPSAHGSSASGGICAAAARPGMAGPGARSKMSGNSRALACAVCRSPAKAPTVTSGCSCGSEASWLDAGVRGNMGESSTSPSL
mmetsp:Transcript_40971/g.96457  ORF Transcript_40971/g.96457 Transcript_40971/m.96457 type:complete len:258 (-) Transcript_40971:1232-2005(-)